MPNFHLRIADASGGSVSLHIAAVDSHAAVRAAGVMPAQVLSVELEGDAPQAPTAQGTSHNPSRNAPHPSARTRRFPLRLFSRELAVLLHAGIPLITEALAIRFHDRSATDGNLAFAESIALQFQPPRPASIPTMPGRRHKHIGQNCQHRYSG